MEPESDMAYAAINPNYLHAQKQASQLAQGQYAGSAIAPAAPSFFDQVSSRIQTLGGIIGETNAELSMLGDRVFGGQPQNNTQGSKGVPVGAGHAGSVLEAFDMLLTAAADAAQRARALNSRL